MSTQEARDDFYDIVDLLDNTLSFPSGVAGAATAILEWMEVNGYRKHPESEWEYGVTTKWGMHEHPHFDGAGRYAKAVREEIEDGRASGDLAHHGRIMRRTKAAAGPWVPVGEGEPR